MAALVAAALAQLGDRPAWLAAILADRYRPVAVIVAAILALIAATGLAASAGHLLAPTLTPNAARLLLALALAAQGGGALMTGKPPDRLSNWRLGGFTTSLLGLFILLFGDGVQFIVLALSARGGAAWLAAGGATIGSLAVIIPATLLGEHAWLRLPLRRLRLGIAALFLLTAAVLALGALRLI